MMLSLSMGTTTLTSPFWMPEICSLSWGTLGMPEILGSAYVVVFGAFVSYLLMIVGQRHLEPSTVAAYNYIQPIIAAIVAVHRHQTKIDRTNIVGAVLIFFGMLCVIVATPRNEITRG